MFDYQKIFKRELDRLNYLYAKANTKSKKKRLAYDLILFSHMYNSFSDKEENFAWDYDIDIINENIDFKNDFIGNVLDNQDLIINVVENSFNIFLSEDIDIYREYGKNYHNLDEGKMLKYVADFFRKMDESLVDRLNYKLSNIEFFINNMIDNTGVTYPIEIIDKNIILFSSGITTVYDGTVLVHEMGHDFEFDNSKKSGVINTYKNICKTPYMEVSSSFFEYAFINYLVDNKIYLEDSMMLKRRFLFQCLHRLIDILILDKMENLDIDYDFSVKLKDCREIDYANSLFSELNLCDEYMVGSKINFRDAFIYGIGKLLGIYAYEVYKENPKEFLSKFKTALLQYNNIGMDAFCVMGINSEDLVGGKVLRRVLRESK